ncbi:MAG TPA: DUF1802 family protein [Pirellulales bacterium]|nr:DUF1802 family protein [Pirellulales bacterium]
MKTAFKEWAVICKALASGRQALILRKGGIVEAGGEFRPDQPEFFLFPTFSHQSPDNVVPEARPLLIDLEAEEPETGTIVLRHYATVAEALRVKSLSAVLRLRGQHVWADEVVEERFHRWRDFVYALVVRVYALPQAVVLPLEEEYTGCKSWIELTHDVSTAGSSPVLSDEEFARRHASIRAALHG